MSMRIKTFGAVLGLAVVMAVGASDAASAREGQATTIPAPPSAEAPIPAEAVRQDFADLYAGLRQAHYDLYARTSRADYDQLFADMNAGITGPMTRAEAAAFFQRFMAFGHIAHARVDAASEAYGAYRQAGGRAFPLDIRIRDERIFVALNGSGSDRIAPGDEIVSINGLTAADGFARASTLMSADTP
jgi:hypothetical protein